MPSKSGRSKAQRSAPQSTVAETDSAAAKQSTIFVLGIIVVYLLLAAAFNRLTPFEVGPSAAAAIHAARLPTNPDEAAHVANALAYKSGAIPVFRAGDSNFEAHQPPLYYLLVAPLISSAPGDTEPANAARWLGILLGALSIWLAFRCASELFPDKPYLAQSTAAVVGLLPMNISLCASINNDILTNFMVIAGLWQLARIARRAAVLDTAGLFKQSLCLGAILALGLYTKTSTLALFGAVIVAAAMLWKTKLIGPKEAVIVAAVSVGTALLVASPWLVRNTQLYGDPLAQHIFLSAFIGTTMTPEHMRALAHLSLFDYLWLVVKLTFESFWGAFDSMQVYLPQPIYGALAVVSVAALGGLAIWLKRERLTPEQTVTLAAFAGLIVVTVAGYIRFNATFFQAQGRYLFPALVPIAVFLSMGVSGLINNRSSAATERIPLYLAAGLVLLDIASVQRLVALFGV